MRQLGARLPVPPPVETDVETPSEILPHERHPVETREAYPVEVHRIERNLIEPTPAIKPESAVEAKSPVEPKAPMEPIPPIEAERLVESKPPVEPKSTRPVEGLRITEAVEQHAEGVPETTHHPVPDSVQRPQETTVAGTHRNPQAEPVVADPGPLPNPRLPVEERATAEVPIGRWEEFHDFRRLELGRGSRISLEPVPMRQGAPSRLLSADLDDDRRSSFLTLAVPGIAAILALGAIVWSGSLRDRVRQQDAAMSALQEQNQKLADTLAQMSVDQKVSSALDSSANAPSAPQQTAAPATHPAVAPAPQQAAPSGQPATPSAGKNEAAGSAPAEKETAGQTEQQAGRLQGVSTPPSAGQRGSLSAQQRGARYRQPVAVGYAPEIVPPYPTNFKPDNVTANAANSQPVPSAGAYRQPFTPGAYQEPVSMAGSARPQTNAGTTPRASAPQASTATRLPLPQAANSSPPAAATSSSTAKYSAAGSGPFASPLAQNIEAVEGLQRHSPVQLREFHVRAGTQTQATPNVRLSVQRPDEGRGSYALVVNQGGSSYQLQGQVDRPLVFTDAATHREYALVVLNIADQQVYGYVRATR